MKVYVFAMTDDAKKFQATAHKRGFQQADRIGTAVMCDAETYASVADTSHGFVAAIVEAEVERHNPYGIK